MIKSTLYLPETLEVWAAWVESPQSNRLRTIPHREMIDWEMLGVDFTDLDGKG
jgi:hypothetical protein